MFHYLVVDQDVLAEQHQFCGILNLYPTWPPAAKRKIIVVINWKLRGETKLSKIKSLRIELFDLYRTFESSLSMSIPPAPSLFCNFYPFFSFSFNCSDFLTFTLRTALTTKLVITTVVISGCTKVKARQVHVQLVRIRIFGLTKPKYIFLQNDLGFS